MQFDVFGRRIVVERCGDRWACFERGSDGKRRDASFIIPPDVPEDDVELYLSDLFHESADARRPQVTRLD